MNIKAKVKSVCVGRVIWNTVVGAFSLVFKQPLKSVNSKAKVKSVCALGILIKYFMNTSYSHESTANSKHSFPLRIFRVLLDLGLQQVQ